MKKYFLISINIILIYICYGQDYTYYAQDKVIPFTLNTKSVFIASNTVSTALDLSAIIGDRFKIVKSNFDHSSQLVNNLDSAKSLVKDAFWVEAELIDSALSKQDYLTLLGQLSVMKGIDYIAPAVYNQKNQKLLLSHLFYVQLAAPDDVYRLQALSRQTNTSIIGREKYMPDWYILSAGIGASGNALEMAKYFYETGEFVNTEPDLIGAATLTTCDATDPLFPNQWNLNDDGTQQPGNHVGFDIHACDAWGITTGDPSVIIAMEDDGPLLTHPDLSPNIIASWDAKTGTSPSQQYSNGSETTHGTSTAGIAAAQQNTTDISGVAPNCSLFPISLDFGATNLDATIAAGITYAFQNGASVISNSWSSNGNTLSQTPIAIGNALTQGRPINGGADGFLGSVVVFAAGNNNVSPSDNTIALSDPDILVVGATSFCPERKRYWDGGSATSCDDGEYWWGSNYGPGLDIMAPGIRITTDDNSGSTPTTRSDFNGTSAATPQAAGVAALMLSLYPCLTQEQITTLIENAAWKINTSLYTYSATSGEPNGTWNDEMGYGFLDAFASLNAIVNFSFLQNEDITDAEKRFSLNFIEAGSDVNPNNNINQGEFTVDATANLEIKAPQFIKFEPGFKTVLGGVMFAHIAPYTKGDCSNWVPSLDRKLPVPDGIIAASANSATMPAIVNNIDNAINMQPNPFKRSFTVNFDVLTDGQASSVKVYDITGRLIYEQSGLEALGLKSYNIPINTSASIYIVEACLGENCKTQKMVKYEMD